MKTYTKEEPDEILRRHALRLADAPDGERADLYIHGRKNK